MLKSARDTDSARQAPLHAVRSAGVGSAGDDAKVAARLLERLHIDVGLHGRVLDVADAPGAMGERPLRNCCARWRRSVGCFAVFDVSRGVRRASAALAASRNHRGPAA